jgi:hypothetical protein
MTKKIRTNTLILMSLLIACATISSLTSCSKDDNDDSSDNYSALFSKTDYFIDMLDLIYERYDAFGSKAEKTRDGAFTVTPMGRLIIVKISSYATDFTYDEVKAALAKHYENNPKVNDVFINQGGTITIDCRD